MTCMSVTALRQNIYDVFNNVGRFNEVITVPVKDGEVVCLSGEEYRGMLETMYLMSDKRVAKDIRSAMAEPLSEATPLKGNRI